MHYPRFGIFIFPFFLLLHAELSLAGSDAGDNRQRLSLSMREGMEMVLQKNLDIAIEKLLPSIESKKIEQEKGIFDPSVYASVSHTDSTTPLNLRSAAASAGRASIESRSYNTAAGVTRKGALGTEYSLEITETQTENSFNDFEAEYNAFAGLKITQPLLKDAGRQVRFYRIRLARIGRDISISALREKIIQTLADYKKSYWELIGATEELSVAEESLKLAQSLLDLSRKRLDAQVISPLEVTQAEAGVAARKEAVIIAKKEMEKSENRLKTMLTDDLHTWKTIRIVPADPPLLKAVNLDPDKNLKEGLNKRSDLEQARLEIERKGMTVSYAENQTGLRIDLEGSYGLNGLGDSARESFSDMDGNPEWMVGVTLSAPLGNREARSALSIAEMEKKSALLNLRKLEQTIIVEIDNAISEIRANRGRVDATKTATRLAREALDAENLKFKAGLSTSHNVLQYQEELAEARSREIAAIIDYNISVAELFRVKGTLLEEEGIEFPHPENTFPGNKGETS